MILEVCGPPCASAKASATHGVPPLRPSQSFGEGLCSYAEASALADGVTTIGNKQNPHRGSVS
jgi:hypothetical protein